MGAEAVVAPVSVAEVQLVVVVVVVVQLVVQVAAQLAAQRVVDVVVDVVVGVAVDVGESLVAAEACWLKSRGSTRRS